MSKRNQRRALAREVDKAMTISKQANKAFHEIMLEALKFLEDADLNLYFTEHKLEQFNQRWRSYCREHGLLLDVFSMFTDEINKIIAEVKAEQKNKDDALPESKHLTDDNDIHSTS